MSPFVELLPLMFKSFGSILGNPLFWVLIGVVAFLYRKMAAVSRYLFPTPGVSLRRLILLAIIAGIGGGFLGSFLLIIVGISFNQLGGLSLLFTALLLMLIQRRFLCFAYAGGVLSLSHLLLGFPQQLNVAQVMALVAVLHLVEALLIFATGHLDPLPVYVADQRGEVVGGFNLQKFWPLPLAVFLVGIYPDPGVLKGLINMPDWWPLLKANLGGPGSGSGELVYSMLALPAVLGYGDIAITTTPRQKTRRAAGELAGYSVFLLLLAIAAGSSKLFAYAAALFGPLGHEALIHLERRSEQQGKPLYVPVQEGLKLLHVWRGSPLAKAGVKSGDILLRVNGRAVHDERELREAIRGADTLQEAASRQAANKVPGIFEARHDLVYFAVTEGKQIGRKRRAVLRCREEEALGYVPVPAGDTSRFLAVTTSSSLLQKWWRKSRWGKRKI